MSDITDIFDGDECMLLTNGGYEMFLGGLVVESDSESENEENYSKPGKRDKLSSSLTPEEQSEFEINPRILRNADKDGDDISDATDSTVNNSDSETSDSDLEDTGWGDVMKSIQTGTPSKYKDVDDKDVDDKDVDDKDVDDKDVDDKDVDDKDVDNKYLGGVDDKYLGGVVKPTTKKIKPKVENVFGESEDVESEDVEAEDVESEDVEAEDVEAEDVESEDVESEDVEAEDVESEDVEAEDVESEDVDAEDVESVVENVFGESEDVESDDGETLVENAFDEPEKRPDNISNIELDIIVKENCNQPVETVQPSSFTGGFGGALSSMDVL
jgi:hypothetical protein